MSTIRTLVLCEDDADTADELRLLLASNGYVVHVAGRAAEAFDLVCANPDSILITDIRMPGDSGLDLLAKLREALGENSPPSLVITGHAGVPEAIEALRLGVVDFLQKPVAPSALLTAVQAAVRASDERHSRRRIDLLATTVTAALDRLRTGVVVVRPDLELIHANARGEQILAGGPLTRGRDDRLRAGSQLATARLRTLTATAQANGHAALLIENEEGKDLHIVAVAMEPADGSGAEGDDLPIALFVDDESRTSKLGPMLQRLYGLSPAEARLAEELVAGEPIADAAASFGISLQTARTQLKSIFSKLDVHRQSDMVRKILMGPATAIDQGEGAR